MVRRRSIRASLGRACRNAKDIPQKNRTKVAATVFEFRTQTLPLSPPLPLGRPIWIDEIRFVCRSMLLFCGASHPSCSRDDHAPSTLRDCEPSLVRSFDDRGGRAESILVLEHSIWTDRWIGGVSGSPQLRRRPRDRTHGIFGAGRHWRPWENLSVAIQVCDDVA